MTKEVEELYRAAQSILVNTSGQNGEWVIADEYIEKLENAVQALDLAEARAARKAKP